MSESTTTPPTDDEVVQAVISFLNERSDAGGKVAESASNVSCKDGILTVTFDPAKVGYTVDKLRQINPFPNLAEFVAGPLATTLAQSARLRNRLVRIDTSLPDGSSLGSLTVDEIRRHFSIT